MGRHLRVAFVSYDGLAGSGTEKWMRSLATAVALRSMNVTFFSCGGDSSEISADAHRHRHSMEQAGVRVIESSVGVRSDRFRHRPWQDSNFWDRFVPAEYDVVQAAKAGHPEYPFTSMPDSRIVELRTLDVRLDWTPNIAWTIHLSQFQRRRWINRGGNPRMSSVIPIPVDVTHAKGSLRDSLGISPRTVVLGFHQRVDDNIFSPWPLQAFRDSDIPDSYFLILGGSRKYSEQAQQLGLDNFQQLPYGAHPDQVGRFLGSLDVYAHGRADGETFGAVLAEAMAQGLPVVSHLSPRGANAQVETIADGGFVAGTLKEYSHALLEFAADRDKRVRIGQRARDHAVKFYSLESAANALVDVYAKVASAHESPSKLNHGFYSKTPIGYLQYFEAVDNPVKQHALQSRNSRAFDLQVLLSLVDPYDYFIDFGEGDGTYGLAVLGTYLTSHCLFVVPNSATDVAIETSLRLNAWEDRASVHKVLIGATARPFDESDESEEMISRQQSADMQPIQTMKNKGFVLEAWLNSLPENSNYVLNIDVPGAAHDIVGCGYHFLARHRPKLLMSMPSFSGKRIRQQGMFLPPKLFELDYRVFHVGARTGFREVEPLERSRPYGRYLCVPSELPDFRAKLCLALAGAYRTWLWEVSIAEIEVALARMRQISSKSLDQLDLWREGSRIWPKWS